MSWFRVDDKFAFHAKAVRAGNAAIGVWVRLGAWSSDQLTDGKLPGEIAKVIAGPDVGTLDRLCEVGLLEREGENYAMHDFLDWNPSGKQVKRQRKELSEARSKAGSKGVAKREANRKQTASPSPFPDPIPIPEEKRDPPTPKNPEGFKLTTPDPSPASPAKTKKPAKSDATDDERKVFEGFLRGREYRKVKGGAAPVLDAKRLKLIRERLADGYTPETLAAAAFGIWVSQWHFEEGQSRFDLALRDGDHVERFARVTHEREQDLARFRGDGPDDEDDEDPPPDEDLPPGYVEPPREELIATLERHGLHVGAQVLRENTGKQAAHG